MAHSRKTDRGANLALADPGDEEEPPSGSAERSFAICTLLAEEGQPMALADLCARLSLPKGTVHRLCANLLETGYLSKDLDERKLTVGPALRRLAFNTLNHGSLRGLRHEVLVDLVREVGETCNFTTLDGTQVLYLDRVEARWPLRLTIDVGTHVPLHCTSSGKLFLAHMSDERRDAVIQGIPLTRMTAATITNAHELLQECEQIRKQGYSCDREEFVPGLVSIAVPVHGPMGNVRATISVHAPVARMSLNDAMKRLPAFKAAARRMQRLI